MQFVKHTKISLFTKITEGIFAFHVCFFILYDVLCRLIYGIDQPKCLLELVFGRGLFGLI